MKAEDDRLSLWDLRACLLSSVNFAEGFAHSHPEHAYTITCFSEEIQRINTALMSSFEDELVLSPLHNIVSGLSGARAMASIMAGHHPEKSVPLTRFVEDLKHVQDEFIRKVRTDVP